MSESAFYFGDSDLTFLGYAAMLAARHEMLRKGGQVWLPGYPQSDEEAMKLISMGLMMGMRAPLDDVPQIKIAAYADEDVLHRLRSTCRELLHGGDNDAAESGEE